jgi:very-short-patch-repair endonuclease
LLHVVSGIEVEPQKELAGARADLWLVGTRTLHEYDGEVHGLRRQQKRDLRRLRRLDEAGWARHGYTDDDVLLRAVSVLRDADRAVGRQHRPDRIRPWHDLLKESLFTPAGQARLLRRLGLEEAG